MTICVICGQEAPCLRFETYVAARYLRGKRKNRFVNLISIISVAGVCVGVMALIVVMSVMTGFDNALRETIIGNRSHLTVYERAHRSMFDYKQAMSDVAALVPEAKAIGPVVEIEGLLKNGGFTSGAMVVGVDPELESKVTDLAENLHGSDDRPFAKGALPAEKEIVLGYRLANRIRANIGDEIAVVTAKPGTTPFGMRAASSIYLKVSGISQARMSDFDLLYAWVDIPTAKMLTGSEGVDGIHLKLSDAFLADAVKKRIEDGLPYSAETWYENQEAFFAALVQEKLAMFVILAFIVVVAAFNITSTLIMIVMEKRRDIGILRTLGTGTRQILQIFILEGLMIGLSGTFFGVIFGIVFAIYVTPIAEFLAKIFGVDLQTSSIYYFDGIPSAIIPMDVIKIAGCSIALSFLSTLYPAWSAARLNPVDALRNE